MQLLYVLLLAWARCRARAPIVVTGGPMADRSRPAALEKVGVQNGVSSHDAEKVDGVATGVATGVANGVANSAALEDSHVQTPWLATCRQRTSLHASRWGNCPGKPEPPLPELATPLLRWVRAQQRVVLFGDSLMRDWFTMMVCLLIGASPTAQVTLMSGPHFGLHGVIVLELPEGATLTFVWHQWDRKEFLPVNESSPLALHTKEGLAVRDAKVLFFNMAGAHQRSAAELRVDMSSLVTWLQGASPVQQRVVFEYAPAHFSGTPYGEFDASFFTRPARRVGQHRSREAGVRRTTRA